MRTRPINERLQDLSCPEALTGCTIWAGYINAFGYGCVKYEGMSRLAYHVAWELEYGAVPDGLELDHLCRNRACINVDHLELVTHRENVLRGVGLAALNAKKTHCKRGHELLPNNIRKNRANKRICKICHEMKTREWLAARPLEYFEERRIRNRKLYRLRNLNLNP